MVTGFLGSGKTTLLNRLLASPLLSDSFVVVNEFGEVPVDHLLLESSEERTVALPNGCLCCRLRGDLEQTLVGAAMRRRRGEIAGFDRVIVETSGLADPGPVAQTLFADQGLARDFKLGPIVTVVDASDAENRKFAAGIARSQIAAADLVVLSKTDRTHDLSKVKNEVQAINAHAQCVPAQFGDLDCSLLTSDRNFSANSRADHVFFPVATHDPSIKSFMLRFEKPVARELMERFLAVLVDLRGADLLRVKGIVALEGGEYVAVQGVRHVFDRLRSVAKSETGLVFITNGVERREVDALWQAMSNLKGVS